MAFTLKSVSPKTVFNPKSELQKEYKKFICQVNRFVYRDEETGFFVFSADLIADQPNIDVVVSGRRFFGRKMTVVGNSLIMVQSVVEGQEVEVWGDFEIDKKYDAIQFVASSIQECIPTKPKAIELFLGSGKIYGVGPKIARKIVMKFGAETIKVLDESPERLVDVDGINLKKIEEINKSWKEWRAIYEIVATMKMYGIGDVAGIKIFNHFKEKSISIIKNDPYSLTDVQSIGFKTADKIAQAIGISPLDGKRIEKCLLHSLEDVAEKGSTAFPINSLIEKANEILCVDEELVSNKVVELIDNGLLVEKNVIIKSFKDKYSEEFSLVEIDGVAHRKIYNTEAKIAKEIKRIMLDESNVFDGFNQEKINDFIETNKFELDDSQKIAASTILNSKVVVLTGGPGTGKTHIIKSLLSFLSGARYISEDGNKYLINNVLSAPTGRAAKRMKESTGVSGSTIHRLLGYSEGAFVHNEHNKLSGDVFIVDESSMVDIWLALAFFRAVPSHAKVILVGDVDQLPSVGSGNVLRDIIDSGEVPVARLSVIHRQALNSNIIVASHAIINKKMPNLYDLNSDSDFVFVEENENDGIHDRIEDIVSDLISNGVSQDDIQILTPKKETEVGTNKLNHSMRALLNPMYMDFFDRIGSSRFIPGDRVMQFKNNRDLDIFNGDVGSVLSVDTETGIYDVCFDEKVYKISGGKLTDLNLCYANTIHKSQGSDYPYVIIPISKSHTFMWDANLLYTAVTRGKKRVILVGNKKTLFYSVAHFKQNDRITNLKDLLVEEFSLKNDRKQLSINF